MSAEKKVEKFVERAVAQKRLNPLAHPAPREALQNIRRNQINRQTGKRP